MKEIPGIQKPELQALPQMRDRISYLYVEHCVINRHDSAITIADMRGIVHVPVASICVLLLGPGSNITHRAVELIGDAGGTLIWIGEHGVRYYAHGRPLTHSARLLIRQAALVSNVRTRVAVARQMYQMRFSEDVSSLSMQQLRGREGARVRAIYRKLSKETGVPWNGREYDIEKEGKADKVNIALSIANYCLYGVIQAVTVAMGCSPGLGFVHAGHERSFIFDIADLYKAEITIPIAFMIAKKEPEDIEGETRRAVRDALVKNRILERATKDIKWLLLGNDEEEFDVEELYLWDDKVGTVQAHTSYGKEYDEDATDEAVAQDYKTLEEMNASECSNGKIIDDESIEIRGLNVVYEDDFFAEVPFEEEFEENKQAYMEYLNDFADEEDEDDNSNGSIYEAEVKSIDEKES